MRSRQLLHTFIKSYAYSSTPCTLFSTITRICQFSYLLINFHSLSLNLVRFDQLSTCSRQHSFAFTKTHALLSTIVYYHEQFCTLINSPTLSSTFRHSQVIMSSSSNFVWFHQRVCAHANSRTLSSAILCTKPNSCALSSTLRRGFANSSAL